MGYAIPKIEYNTTDTAGDTTSGNGTIANIADTTDIDVGMFVRGTGVPVGATVGSKTSTSVTLASGVLATATATVALVFGTKIELDYPPIEVEGETLDPQERRSKSLSGESQVSVDFIEGVRNLLFSHISSTLKTSLQTFHSGHAGLGYSFRYFEDKAVDSYVTYELKTLTWKPRKLAPAGLDVYVWNIPLQFSRVVS